MFSATLLNKRSVIKLVFKSFSTSAITHKTVPSAKGKSHSSNQWITRQLNDIYVKKSRYDHYRCRSAYKLIEMDEKYNFIKPKSVIVECGAAPGSWTQVAVRKLKLNSDSDTSTNDVNEKGLVIAVDLRHIEPIKGAILLKESDFTNPEIQEKVFNLLPDGKADVVLSDMAPNASGNTELDAAAIMNLVYSALKFSMKTLKQDGTFLCKVFDNNDVEKMYRGLGNLFSSVKRIKPDASRSNSTELYLLARGFKCTHSNTN